MCAQTAGASLPPSGMIHRMEKLPKQNSKVEKEPAVDEDGAFVLPEKERQALGELIQKLRKES